MTPKKICALGVLIIVVLFLTACGGPDPYATDKISNGYSIVRLPWMGGFVDCIKLHRGSSDEQWGGLTCDFEHWSK